jgi:alkanesulfonate monooxygenase SsuD/methylene tetrahydromethanopterin reductase-like flavin-dependent oxidoreductase (luciferase family)
MRFYLSGLGNLYENLNIILEGIVEADRLGFDGALMPDHYMWGDQIGHRMNEPYNTLETWTTLSYLAGMTQQIKLGTLVSPLPFRHPARLAKRLATLDVLSGGRVVLGVGAGWSKVEFDGFSKWGGPKYRVNKTIEALEIMKRLWTEDDVTFNGEFYNIKGAVVEPKPVQRPHPLLLFGSTGKRMLNLTGKHADICFIPPWTGNQYEVLKETIEKAAERAGRKGKLAFMLGEMGARTPYNYSEYSRKIESAIESGASYYNTTFPRNQFIESMKSFAEEILPSYKKNG